MQDHLLDEKLRQRAKDESLPLPEDYEERVFSTCAGLPEHPAKKRRAIRWQAAAVAALAVFLAVPNLSASAAAAMERVPLLGSIVRVITVRSIYYGGGHGTAEVTVPEIQGDSSAAGSVNRDVQAYTDRLLTQFQEDCKTLGEGYESLDVSYDVLTDSMRALKLEAEGYKVSVVEYISPLDTPKNLLIRAVRTGRENRRAKADYEAVRRTLGTTSELDRRCMDMENEFFVTDEDLIP